MRRIAICLACLLWVVVCGNLANTAGAQTSAPGNKKPLALTLATSRPIGDFSLDEVARHFTAFKHEPFETAGVNPLMLPMRFRSVDGKGNSDYANAMSFMISQYMDWIPGNYCARHAYFTFKRSGKVMPALARKYDAELIAIMIREWEATLAVGGELVQGKNGFSGTLEIYDKAGKRVLTQKYEKPREFFQLLGDMTVDVMKFVKYQPTEALIKELHAVRCSMESLADLGSVAFAKERSPEEFGVYDKIVRNDPDFADVRYWWANQTYWGDMDRQKFNREKLRCLESYPVISALGDVDLENDPALLQLVEKHLDNVNAMTGVDHPDVMRKRLEVYEAASRPVPPDVLKKATQLAAMYPNAYHMLCNLAYAHDQAVDPYLGACIALAASRSRFMTAVGDNSPSRYAFIALSRNAGLGHLGLPEARRLQVEQTRDSDPAASWTRRVISDMFFEMGHYGRAARCYLTSARESTTDVRRRDCVTYGIVAAILGGDEKTHDIFVSEFAQDIPACPMPSLFPAYRAIAEGKAPDEKALIADMQKKNPAAWLSYRLALAAFVQWDLMQGKQVQREWFIQYMKRDMGWRPYWILFDAYDRKDPSPDSAAMYERLAWLHGQPGQPYSDPWVIKAVADFRKRQPRPAILTPAEVEELLKDFEPSEEPAQRQENLAKAKAAFEKLPPGAVFCAAHELIKARQYDRAIKLALQNRQMAFDLQSWRVKVDANVLLHLVEQAKDADPKRGTQARITQRGL